MLERGSFRACQVVENMAAPSDAVDSRLKEGIDTLSATKGGSVVSEKGDESIASSQKSNPGSKSTSQQKKSAGKRRGKFVNIDNKHLHSYIKISLRFLQYNT